MMNAYTMRNLMELGNYNTSITREAFEAHFTKTKESVRFTFNGWDGKSYDGESRNAKVIRTDYPGYEEVRLIKVGNHLCYIDEESVFLRRPPARSTWKQSGWLKSREHKEDRRPRAGPFAGSRTQKAINLDR
jgi:hypothetical protein